MMAAVVLLLASATAAPVMPEADRPRLQVTMHLDRGVTIERDRLTDVAATVRAIWRPYADVHLALPGAHASLVAADELHLTMTNRTLPRDHGTGLGWVDFVNGEPLAAISISLTAVRRLTDDASWRGRPILSWPAVIAREFERRVIARAIAHEVGHYVLRTKHHASTGLMRATLTATEVMDRPPDAERLADADVRRLRECSSLVARSER